MIRDVLFDRVISVKFKTFTVFSELVMADNTVIQDSVETPDEFATMNISCPLNGPKPDISVRLSMLPGLLCHEVTLTIVNLNAEIDITKFREMEITAGYAVTGFRDLEISNKLTYTEPNNEQLTTFVCPIFSSYIESPNPNGRTVFKGITVGNIQKQLTPNKVGIVFREDTVRLEDLCMRVITGLGLRVEINWPENIRNITLTMSKQQFIGKSGYAIINWLFSRLSELSQGSNPVIPNDRPILVSWENDTIRLGYAGYSSNSKILDVVDLTRVTAVSLQGGTMVVKAPWNPRIVPGAVFRMEARYFRGRMSPNDALSQLLSSQDMYSVITVDLSFSTTADNEMSVLAIPVMWNEDEGGTKITVNDKPISAEDSAQSVTEVDTAATVIEFGNKGANENTGPVYQVDLGNTQTMTKYLVRQGDTLAGIAAKYYSSIKYIKTEDSEGRRLQNPYDNNSMPAGGYTGRYFWPVIYFATVQAMKSDAESFWVNEQNPNALEPGRYIAIPSLTNPDDLKNGQQLFNDAADLWESLITQNLAYGDSMCVNDFKTIAFFMGVN